MTSDYYDVLGVGRNASQEEIKKAFKKKAMQHHPDRNSDNKVAAEKKFKEINQAYEILGDSSKRANYDKFGHSATGGGGSGFAGGFQDFGVDLNDIFGGFEDIFGGGRSGGSKSEHKQRGSDLRYKLTITLDEAFNGKEELISFFSLSSCTHCNSSGSMDGTKGTCSECRGSGRTRVQQGFFIMEKTCKRCGGVGEIVKNPCKKCAGQGRVKKERTVRFNIPPGVENGTSIRLSGNGEAGERGSQSGDLYINITVKEHDFFQRNGNDIIIKVPVLFTIMALGGKIKVPTINNNFIELDIPSNTQSESKFKIKNKGMPITNSSTTGDMYVITRSDMPNNLNKEQKSLLEALHKSLNSNNDIDDSFFRKMKSMFK